MIIGIITAMSSEHAQLANLLENKSERKAGIYSFIEGSIGKHHIVLMQCGIGKVNAAVGTTELIRYFHPHCIISTSCAGGIDTQVGVMDVVVSSRLVYHDVWCGEGEYGQVQGLPAYYEGHPTLLKCATSLDTTTKIHSGLICTGDKFISDAAELSAIKSKFPTGLAVDMESTAIAQTCHLFSVPFLSFRIISDTPGADKHYEQYQNFWQEMADRSFAVTKTFLQSIPEQL